MNVVDIPTASGLALAWLRCGAGLPRVTTRHARVTVLAAVRSAEPAAYFRFAPNPGSAIDIGSSSGTNFASFSASSYST